MPNEDSSTVPARRVRTLASDREAFRHRHAFDKRADRVMAADVAGMLLVESRISFEIFRFESPEVGKITFNVKGIKDALANGALDFAMYVATLDVGWVEHTRNNNGVEPERLASLTPDDLRRPGILVLWPGSPHSTLIDGAHRLCRRWDDGLRTFRFAVVPVSKALLPYLCETGQEDTFLDRQKEPGFTVIGRKRLR
jgi:hypothetical protein